MKALSLCVSISFLHCFVNGKYIPIKEYPECDKWAVEGECLNNPNFMWNSCQASCMFGDTAAVDVMDECQEWASTGECTANPNYIQLHCPASCNRAVGWSPWARESAGVNKFLPYSEEAAADVCPDRIPRSIFGAAELLHGRLETYLSGDAGSVKGLSSTAPTEYLGMMGLAEGFLYASRLYSLILSQLKASATDDVESALLANHIASTEGFVADIEHVLSQGYGSDLLMRTLPTWLPQLKTLSDSVLGAIQTRQGTAGDICSSTVGPDMQSLVASASKIHGTVAPLTNIKQVDGDSFLLNNGQKLPAIGLGTWQLNGAALEQSVEDAIAAGYRHIDSAQAYGNEIDIGWAVHHAIVSGRVTREELFLATKLSDEKNGGYTKTRPLVLQQLANLKTDYIDLYMLHSPFRNFDVQMQTWSILEQLVDAGAIKTLGVSNFNGKELRRLVENARIPPAVVQNKLDVYHVGKQLDNEGDDIVGYARSKGIVVVAYSPFSSYPFALEPIYDPIIDWIAAKHSIESGHLVSPSQVILKWAIDKGFAAIPRSSSASNLKENIAATSVKLTADDISLIDALQYLVSSPVSKAVAV